MTLLIEDNLFKFFPLRGQHFRYDGDKHKDHIGLWKVTDIIHYPDREGAFIELTKQEENIVPILQNYKI